MRVNLLLFVVMLATVAAGAQDGATESQPVIRVGTRLVEVDVVVRDKKGPVTTLTKDDFTLLDRGKPQKVAVFSVNSAHSAGEQPTPLPPGAVSNRMNSHGEVPANATILLFDRLNTGFADENYAHQQILKFIRSLGEKDLLALYSLGNDLRVVQDFTNDRERLLAGAADLNPLIDPLRHDDPAERPQRRAEARMQQEERRAMQLDHTRITQNALEAIARHLAGLPGRKNLVWIADSFVPDPDPDLLRRLEDSNIAMYLVDAHGEPPVGVSPEIQRPQVFSTRARGRGQTPDPVQAEETIADSTGGLLLYHTNDLSGSIRKAIEDASQTYTLGFYPSQASLDGTFHKITVKVAKKGLDVRHRENYFAYQEQAPTARELRDALNQLIGDSLDATAIGLTAQFDRARGHAAVFVDLGDVHLDQQDDRWVGAINLAMHVDQAPSMTIQTVHLNLTRDELLAGLKTGYAIRTGINMGEQVGVVRLVVQDTSTGAAGSILIKR